jgi:hypothetical protein
MVFQFKMRIMEISLEIEWQKIYRVGFHTKIWAFSVFSTSPFQVKVFLFQFELSFFFLIFGTNSVGLLQYDFCARFGFKIY